MRVLIPNEIRLLVTPDGRAWTDGPATYSFWRQYLEAFDQVSLIARARRVTELPPGAQLTTGEHVQLVAVPWYIGPLDYAIHAVNVRRKVGAAVDLQSAIILRVPGNISSVALGLLEKGRPYGAELVGDPYEVFAPGALRHPMRRFFRWSMTRRTRDIVGGAAAVSYVSDFILPERYPPAEDAFWINCSDIELLAGHFRRQPISAEDRILASIITVGSLDQLYKGTDVLLRAVAALKSEFPELTLRIVGDGRFRKEFEALASQLGVADRTNFLGQLPSGDAVRMQLDRSTLFVLASRAEGLPRALIEAMARGLPCVATSVGGIPELLPSEDLVRPNDAEALASKIAEVLRNPARVQAMSVRNLEVACNYRSDVLLARRIAFYRQVRDRTEEWLRFRAQV